MTPRRVALVTLGCARNEVDSEELAERYGVELAAALPEADAVLGFDSYDDVAARLSAIVAGERPESHVPRDRRTLLPVAPVDRRPDLPSGVGPASGPRPVRRRLGGGPVAPLKLASGCDRRCAFCAIPSFRGAFVSRHPDELLAEAEWLAAHGVRELHLVSENSTSYGKDLGDVRLLERLLPRIAAVPGIARVRLAYLQPAEMRPGLVEAIASTPGVAPYFDLSFQHASPSVLRRMRRFGGTAQFLDLVASIRAVAPDAGIRSNVIVGFPGETRADVAELEHFLGEARLDAVGVFRYSDEDGTEAATYDRKVRADVATRRYARVTTLAETLTAARAEERVGSVVSVLVESVSRDGGEGRAEHQAPEVDGSVRLVGSGFAVGDVVAATVVASEGVDLVAEVA